MDLQPAASPLMEQVRDFHGLLLTIITLIVLIVFALLVWVMVKYNSKANPEPRRFSHNTMVEVVWTVIPIFILLIIAVPSFRLLYSADRTPEADLTIKAVGYQWYWGHEYPDYGVPEVYSYMLSDEEAAAQGLPRTLAVDENVVVPVGKTVRIITTADDVIHAWTIPAFGVKVDAIPGRLNETWFRADKEGVYYGQCSELCGINHSYMPIAVEAVSEQEFQAWVDEQRGLAGLEPMFDTVQVAEAAAAPSSE